jgi:hypothetical protein
MFKKIGKNLKMARDTTLVTIGMATSSLCFANNDPNAAVQKATGLLQTIKTMLPVAAQVGGVVILIGGLWSMYQHYKSGGRDGSIATGIAGILIGAAMFFIAAVLNMGANALDINTSTQI